MARFLAEKIIELDREKLMEVSKALFYGYVFLAGVSLTINHEQTGTLFGLAVLSSLSMAAMAISEGLKEDWQKFLDSIAIITLMLAIIFGSYISLTLATGVLI